MAIKASSAKQIDTLIADLTGANAVKREAAVARLTVIGARAVERLVALAAADGAAAARASALRALEGIADERALEPALDAIDDADAAVACAALAVARVFMRGAKGAAVVDRLTAVALDPRKPEEVRVAAVRALRDLEPATVAPLMKSLAGDPSATVRAEAQWPSKGKREKAAQDPVADLTRAAEADLPDGAAHLRHLLARAGDDVPLPTVLRIIERVRDREASEPAARRAEWTTTRAAAHLVLARRGSRLALYDLRESLEQATAPLPVDTLAALSLIGDASCLEPIASAYARSTDEWWREHLADAFRAIAKRERLTRRHAVMKRIAQRMPDVFVQLAG